MRLPKEERKEEHEHDPGVSHAHDLATREDQQAASPQDMDSGRKGDKEEDQSIDLYAVNIFGGFLYGDKVDESGVKSKDVTLVWEQAGTTRSKAVEALRAEKGDIVDAIRALMP